MQYHFSVVSEMGCSLEDHSWEGWLWTAEQAWRLSGQTALAVVLKITSCVRFGHPSALCGCIIEWINLRLRDHFGGFLPMVFCPRPSGLRPQELSELHLLRYPEHLNATSSLGPWGPLSPPPSLIGH